jgi:hypothetical protein
MDMATMSDVEYDTDHGNKLSYSSDSDSDHISTVSHAMKDAEFV